PLADQPSDHPSDGGGAGAIRVQALGQEGPEREGGAEDAVAPAHAFVAQGLFDLLGGKHVTEGKAILLAELSAERTQEAGQPARQSMAHRGAPCQREWLQLLSL